jgi:hypothetical protein
MLLSCAIVSYVRDLLQDEYRSNINATKTAA